VVAAVLACPTVSGMAEGSLPAAATYLPGRRVQGVRGGPGGVEVHVVARWEADLARLGEDVRRAVGPLVEDRPVTVFVDDIEVPAR